MTNALAILLSLTSTHSATKQQLPILIIHTDFKSKPITTTTKHIYRFSRSDFLGWSITFPDEEGPFANGENKLLGILRKQSVCLSW